MCLPWRRFNDDEQNRCIPEDRRLAAARTAVSLSDALDGAEQFQIVQRGDFRPAIFLAASDQFRELPEGHPSGQHGLLLYQFPLGDRSDGLHRGLLRGVGGIRSEQSAVSAAEILADRKSTRLNSSHI